MNLSALKSKALQHIAFLTGLPSTGTKAQIAGRLSSSLQQPKLPNDACRVLSVDMGIRNLAYCVIDVPSQSQTPGTKLSVHSWKRLDLLGRLKTNGNMQQLEDGGVATELPDGVAANAILKESFTPSIMSKAALTVAQDFLKYKPDVILIERQRFRSGGGSAIQEWTVRVNTLESMLWACFETLRSSQAQTARNKSPMVYEVSPKRVANFWTAPPGVHLPSADLLSDSYTPPEGKVAAVKSKAASTGKKEKIAVLRSWLDRTGDVELVFSPETEVTAAAFATGLGRRKTKGDVTAAPSDAKRETKLDDLADCVLQGAAWVRWEENRRAIVTAVAEQADQL
ncbi:hypothetical protein Q7P37_009167 [Cladosporium fusiforme]